MSESRSSTDIVHLDEYESGRFVPQGSYESFLPSPVNHGWVWDDPRINALLEEATQALGELNTFSRIIPDVDLFIQLHVVKEATDSSRIEGTRTEMEETTGNQRNRRYVFTEYVDLFARG
jgi:hypothetical protein